MHVVAHIKCHSKEEQKQMLKVNQNHTEFTLHQIYFKKIIYV